MRGERRGAGICPQFYNPTVCVGAAEKMTQNLKTIRCVSICDQLVRAEV